MNYLVLKTSHISFVVCGYALFLVRGIWSLNGSAIMRKRWVRVAPHVVDTLLLISAILLALTIRQYPFMDSWLTAKVVGLLLYIGLGVVALRNSIGKSIRFFAWLAAQAVFVYIVLVAVTRNPVPWRHFLQLF
ncbi:MAG: SirB2 family protein [Betaproteobacteria bacterium]|nr:SirB2 family protein [Betaproteobacteria bacterium]